MSESNESVRSWAIEEDSNLHRDRMEPTHNVFVPPRTETESEMHSEVLDATDLRHRLRRSRCENHGEDHSNSSDCHSPLKSPARPRRQRSTPDNNASRPNYRREIDGLSPLRSPLNPEQRTSRVDPRRRSARDDGNNKKENEEPKATSPSKRNKSSEAEECPYPMLDMNVEEQKFRRRLDLPPQEKSENEEEGDEFLNPEIEEDRMIVERREKQIAYGKMTESYQLYAKTVPKSERGDNRKRHPRTPIKLFRCSRRNWDAQIKAWKKYVHQWANVNFPTMAGASPNLPEAESGSGESSSAWGKAQNKEKEEDNNLDLNAVEDDESFLEDFELNYEFGEPQSKPDSESHA